MTLLRLAISQFTGTDSRTSEKRPFPDVHHPFTNTVSALCGHLVSSVGVGQGSIAGSLHAQFIGIQYIQTFDQGMMYFSIGGGSAYINPECDAYMS